jgi:hypothetical protein
MNKVFLVILLFTLNILAGADSIVTARHGFCMPADTIIEKVIYNIPKSGPMVVEVYYRIVDMYGERKYKKRFSTDNGCESFCDDYEGQNVPAHYDYIQK